MKHVFLAGIYPPPLEGGSAIYYHNLISHFPPADVLVITNARPGHEQFDHTQAYRIWRSWIEARNFRKLEKLRALAEWFLRFFPRLMDEQVDLVHAGDPFICGMMAWLYKRLKGCPYLVYVFAEELNGRIQNHRGFWDRMMWRVFRRVLRDSDGIVGVSDYTLSLLPSYEVDTSKAVKILPMVIAFLPVPQHEVDSLRVRYGLDSTDRVVLTVGRLVERKGQDSLIRAFARVLMSVPSSRLVIAGRGPDETKLKTLVSELGLEASVVLAGFVPEAELPALFELCEVFAMPHHELADGDTEGCPTVFLEANAHGKPTVGGRAGGVRDAIIDGETGILVDGENPEEIASALLLLLEDRDMASRLGERGRRRVLEECTPEKGAEVLLAYSRSIIQKWSTA